MTGYLLAALGVLGGLGMTVIGDMVSDEVRDRLDHLPHAILRLAARRLDPALRVMVYEDEWLPELIYILKGDEARPVTRLIHGVHYSVSILVHTRRIARHLDPAVPVRPYVIRLDSAAFLAVLVRQREQVEERITALTGSLSAAQIFAADRTSSDQDRIDAQVAVRRLQESLATLTKSQKHLTDTIRRQQVHGHEVHITRMGRRTRLRVRVPR